MPRTAGTSWLLIPLGTGSLLCYAVMASLSEQFVPFQKQSDRPILEVLGCLGLAYLLYLLSVWLVMRDGATPRGSWLNRIILGGAISFRLVQLTANPIQEIDIYRYLWDGRVTLAGVNPYACSPQAIEDRSIPLSVQQRLDAVRAEPGVEQIFQTVDHRQVPTVYPPLSQVVFTGAAALTSPDWPVPRQIVVMKLLMVLFDLGTIGLVMALLQAVGRPVSWCVIYAWCPLAIKEVANSGHLDAIAVFFATATMLLLIKRRPYLAGVTWAAAILSKVYPVLLLPLIAAYLWRTRQGRYPVLRVVVPLALTTGLVAAVYALVWPHDAATTPLRGLRVFLSEWKMNDLVFDLVYRSLDSSAGPWLREQVSSIPWWPTRLATANEPSEPVSPSFVLTYALLAIVWLGIALWLAWRVVKAKDVNERLLEGAFYALALFLLLSPTCNPWYFLWALPFLPWARQRSWQLLPGLLLVYYLRFWFIYRDPASGAAWFDHVVVWFEYLPFFVALSTEAACGVAAKRQAPSGPRFSLPLTSRLSRR